MESIIVYGLLAVSLVWGVASIVKFWNAPKVEAEKTEQKQGKWDFIFKRREQKNEQRKEKQEKKEKDQK